MANVALTFDADEAVTQKFERACAAMKQRLRQQNGIRSCFIRSTRFSRSHDYDDVHRFGPDVGCGDGRIDCRGGFQTRPLVRYA